MKKALETIQAKFCDEKMEKHMKFIKQLVTSIKFILKMSLKVSVQKLILLFMKVRQEKMEKKSC